MASNNDRVKLPFTYSAEKVLTDISALSLNPFEYYDVIPLRAPAHLIDNSIPFPPPATNYANGSWTEWLDSDFLKKSSYLKSIVHEFSQHTKVTLVRLLRLAPHSEVKEHTDPTLGLHIPESVIRLTIPITYSDQVTFYLSGTPVNMLPGECWYLNLTQPHRITNTGDTERINLTIDMIPNDWVKKQILG